MNSQLKGYLGIALFFALIWGIGGLISGNGFFGGISMNIDAIGDIVAILLKIGLGIGALWLLIRLLDRK